MLTFEEKQAIIESFPQLTRKDVSMKRLNYHYLDSLYDKTIVVYHLHPNGNGFVFVGDLQGYQADKKGLMNIRNASEEELRKVISDSIKYLSEGTEDKNGDIVLPEYEWLDQEGHKLILTCEETLWNIYAGMNLVESFPSYEDAESYLREEGFKQTV
ncbi:hypothetical protein [Lederbergia galactosidilytica]|uniref:Uncharacterized protein n=1 Tax=Lederbergia galactosidilytica TaxID=217031 RepID=A0A0Q9Y0U2_9BACI|nr:hypothetical protein [Lederbergia galactosidilytica]KRG12781.1 hypothetical protein ACA30_17935 [Virgibacillus soli]KRG14639.1 hypothetical protein ACA29_05730 [Lederbergia galactosidilytica]MBP1917018.1 hypothetical protein [Lederbergia galactosidilytica]OAK70543.1 hypothetical protein ABB05_12365 [Lederbergia galactosidilytica]